jgi:hypothetical protein
MRKAWLSAVSWDSMSLLQYEITTYLNGNFYFRIFLTRGKFEYIFLLSYLRKYKKPGIYSGISNVYNALLQNNYLSERFKFHDSIINWI